MTASGSSGSGAPEPFLFLYRHPRFVAFKAVSPVMHSELPTRSARFCSVPTTSFWMVFSMRSFLTEMLLMYFYLRAT